MTVAISCFVFLARCFRLPTGCRRDVVFASLVVAVFTCISVLYPASFFPSFARIAAWSQKQGLSWPDNTTCQPTKKCQQAQAPAQRGRLARHGARAGWPCRLVRCVVERTISTCQQKASRAMGFKRPQYFILFYFILRFFLCLVSSGLLNRAVATRCTCLDWAKAHAKERPSRAGAPE